MSNPMDNAPESGTEFVERWQANADHLEQFGMYDPADEHASCGVGMIATMNGLPNRRVVTAAIEALKKIWHRGAVDADGKTGDGAGIHVQIPWEFVKEHIRHTGHEPLENSGWGWQGGARGGHGRVREALVRGQRRQGGHRAPLCMDRGGLAGVHRSRRDPRLPLRGRGGQGCGG